MNTIAFIILCTLIIPFVIAPMFVLYTLFTILKGPSARKPITFGPPVGDLKRDQNGYPINEWSTGNLVVKKTDTGIVMYDKRYTAPTTDK